MVLSGAKGAERKNKVVWNPLFSKFSNSFASMLQKRCDHKTQQKSREQKWERNGCIGGA